MNGDCGMQMRAIHKKGNMAAASALGPAGAAAAPARPALLRGRHRGLRSSPLPGGAPRAPLPGGALPALLLGERSAVLGSAREGVRGVCSEESSEIGNPPLLPGETRRQPVSRAALHPPTATSAYNGRSAPSSPSPWPRPAPASFIKSA